MRQDTYYRHPRPVSYFFKFIFITFGEYALELLKLWIKQKTIIRSTLRIKFLKFCINNNIIPQHLCYLQSHNINLTNYCTIHKYKRLVNTHTEFKILRMELNDAFRTLHNSRSHIFCLSRKIFHCIPINICNSFMNRQERSLYQFYCNEKIRLNKKIKYLRKKDKKNSISKIKKINYCYYRDKKDNHLTNTQQFATFPTTMSQENNKDVIEIKLDPQKYSKNIEICPLDSVNDKWFINLSHRNIPFEVQCLLQLGQNFSLPANNKNENIIQLIKNIENNIIKLHSDTQKEIRNRSIPIMHNFMSSSSCLDINDRKINNLLKVTSKFIKNNSDIIYSRADKGNITVALDRIEYMTKLENMFNDNETYEKIKKTQ